MNIPLSARMQIAMRETKLRKRKQNLVPNDYGVAKPCAILVLEVAALC